MTEEQQYEIFQDKYKELSEFTLAKPDEEIDLDSYQSSCGTTSCIVGNAAALWPEEYVNELGNFGLCPLNLTTGRAGTNIIYDLAGLDIGGEYWPSSSTELRRLFGSNPYRSKPDRRVIEDRLALVMKHKTLASLCKTLYKRTKV